MRFIGVQNRQWSFVAVTLRALILVLVIYSSSCAHADDTKRRSWSGYLVDAHTASSYKKSAHPSVMVCGYSKSEALTESARTAGYELYSAGKWFKLDGRGSPQAASILEKSIRKRGFYVLVHGSLKGDLIETEKITELVGIPVRQKHFTP